MVCSHLVHYKGFLVVDSFVLAQVVHKIPEIPHLWLCTVAAWEVGMAGVVGTKAWPPLVGWLGAGSQALIQEVCTSPENGGKLDHLGQPQISRFLPTDLGAPC